MPETIFIDHRDEKVTSGKISDLFSLGQRTSSKNIDLPPRINLGLKKSTTVFESKKKKKNLDDLQSLSPQKDVLSDQEKAMSFGARGRTSSIQQS